MPNPSIKNEKQHEVLLENGYVQEKSAKNVGIENRSKMKKKELIHALRNN